MWYHIETGGGVMNISSDIKPISFLKSHAADILKQINDTHRPIVITQNGEPRGVLQDPESYDNMRKAIGLLKLISQGEEDVKQGNTKTQDRVFKDIEKMLAKKEK
jgi:prevent-host-death family protein